jgi:DNA modification methylase
MLRHNSNNVKLDKKLAREYNPHIFKTKLVGNVWEIPVNSKTFARKETKSTKKGHSGYPVELTDTCLLLSTKPNDLVLDPFMGSGTTGVSCKKYNRRFIGIEIEEEYYTIAKERINNTEQSLTI